MSMIMLRIPHATQTQVLKIAIASSTGSAILQNFRLRSSRRICFMMSSSVTLSPPLYCFRCRILSFR